MATMKQVAERAQVSVSTVSHVLNATRFVSPEARSRIERAMHDLSYVPSAVARSLKHNVTRTLGIMSPNNTNPYFAEVIRSIEDRCFAADYNVVLCNSDDDPYKQSVYLRVLMEKRVDGLIVITSGDSDDLSALLSRLTIPLVLVDRGVDQVECDIVSTDHQRSGYLATQHLISLGHTQIACIAGPEYLPPSSLRIAGWRQAMSEAGLPADKLVCSDFTSQGGHEAMSTVLTRWPQASAVFACNDLMAIGALCSAHEAGLSVPQQLSIIGMDDIELAAFMSPPLTTIAQPKQRIGELAVEMLFERLNTQRNLPRKVALEPELRIRASTMQPARISQNFESLYETS